MAAGDEIFDANGDIIPTSAGDMRVEGMTPDCCCGVCPVECIECPDSERAECYDVTFSGIEWATDCVDCNPASAQWAKVCVPTFTFPVTRCCATDSGSNCFEPCCLGAFYDTFTPYSVGNATGIDYTDFSFNINFFAESDCTDAVGCGNTRWLSLRIWLSAGLIHLALFSSDYSTGISMAGDCVIGFHGTLAIGATCKKEFTINNAITGYGAYAAPADLVGMCTDDLFCALGKNGSATLVPRCEDDI